MQDNRTLKDLRIKGPNGPLSQGEVALKANLSHKQMCKIEQGLISSPHPDTIRRLAEALGVQPLDVVNAIENAVKATAP